MDPMSGSGTIDRIIKVNPIVAIDNPNRIPLRDFELPNKNMSLNEDAKHSLLRWKVSPAISERIHIKAIVTSIEFRYIAINTTKINDTNPI